MTKNIVNFSGGKDSTAMLLMMIEKSMPIDEIIFCDTGKEFPAMYEHIDKVEKYIGMPITRLQPKKTFNYYLFEHVKTRGKNKGATGYGWTRSWVRWCTRLLKVEVIEKHIKKKYGNEKINHYIGIAYDEPKRHERKTEDKIHPLYDWQITEADALQYCYDKGFDWNGLYEYFSRLSCWCCPLQGIDELRQLKEHFPDLWQELKEMDDKTNFKFRPDYSVIDLEIRFQLEEEYRAQGKPLKSKIFYTELKKRLGRDRL